MARRKLAEDPWRTEMGQKIRAARTEKKLSMKDVADKAGIFASSLGHIERGEYYVSQEMVDKIMAAIDALEVKDEKKPSPNRKGAEGPNIRCAFAHEGDAKFVRDTLEPLERGAALLGAAQAAKQVGGPVAAVWFPADFAEEIMQKIGTKNLYRLLDDEIKEREPERV